MILHTGVYLERLVTFALYFGNHPPMKKRDLLRRTLRSQGQPVVLLYTAEHAKSKFIVMRLARQGDRHVMLQHFSAESVLHEMLCFGLCLVYEKIYAMGARLIGIQIVSPRSTNSPNSREHFIAFVEWSGVVAHIGSGRRSASSR